MSDDQSRGRRRPSREFYSGPSTSTCRPSEHDIEEEPIAKHFKKDSPQNESDGLASKQGSILDRATSGRGDADSKDRNRRNRLELVYTRPSDIVTKVGAQGTPIRIQTNYFRLDTPKDWTIYQYHVTFKPEIELVRIRAGVLSNLSNLFGGYLYDGSKLFCTKQLSEEKSTLTTESKRGDKYSIGVKFVGVISMKEWQSLQILNLILRRSMEGLKLQLVGRNYYDAVAKIDIREHRFQLWPGYQTAIRQFEKNILLCAEVTHKVMRTETVYDILTNCTRSASNYQEDFRKQVLGLTVLTDYNNRTYCINDVDFKQTPKMTFSCKNEDVSFIDYYKTRYNIRIQDPNQPLLISKSKDRTIRGGGNDLVILIPELCRPTGLTDVMRSNFQLMRAMADHTRMNPDRRMERLRVFNRRLHETDASSKVLKEWNMKLDNQLVEVNARILESQKIIFGNDKKESVGEQADWTRLFRDNALFTTPSRGLERWVAISPHHNARDMRNFIETVIRVGKGMNFNISRPREFTLSDDRNHSYIQAIDDCCRQDPQLILCVVPNNNAERYASIKKKGCLEHAVPTQVITQKSAGNPRGLMSIATKVAIQMNCKLGYTPWTVNLPLKGLMTIGYDVAKSTRDRSKAFAALVATMDMQKNATFYSTVSECNANDILANNLWPMMTKALRQFRKEHGELPTRIIFYRDGVGEGSLQQVYEHEVKDIVAKLEEEYKRSQPNKVPMLAYVVVTKSLNSRFFYRARNPPPGTVVDDVVTQPERYDFFLVSQSVRQGTVSPISYNIVYSNIRLTPDQVQMLTYKMTHLYYNWSGTTRVPAVCQYAKKLATLVATCLHQPPSSALEKKLFYL